MDDVLYKRIPNLIPYSIGLIPTESYFWVGVDSENTDILIDRAIAKRFRRCPVYMYNGKRVFSYKYDNGNMFFYYIPDEELFHIQRADFYG